jgi:mannosyltransferase OCH1-like enzyme
MPDHLADNVSKWRALHPNWVYVQWSEINLDWLEHRDLFERAEELVPPDAVGQFRSDIARYEILRDYGGLYVDCDTYPLKPVDDALEGLKEFAASEDGTWVGNTYLASVAGHPVMQEIVDGLRRNVIVNRRARANRMSGPQYLTPIWKRHHCHIAPQHQWFPVTYQEAKRNQALRTDFPDDVYAVHEWNHVRSRLR